MMQPSKQKKCILQFLNVERFNDHIDEYDGACAVKAVGRKV